MPMDSNFEVVLLPTDRCSGFSGSRLALILASMLGAAAPLVKAEAVEAHDLAYSAATTASRAVPRARSGQVAVFFSRAAGGKRGFYVSLPADYRNDKTYKLLVVFPGTDTKGKEMKAFVGDGWGASAPGLERSMADTIFVYPDPKWRFFSDWNETIGGWLLEPHGDSAAGNEDLAFVDELLDWMQANYRIDTQRVFATGHSWGGDMAAVAGCFLGHRFKAIAPVAANRPYWFESGNQPLGCTGQVSVWTFFGLDDEHFADQQAHPGDFGREQNQFWTQRLACPGNHRTLTVGGRKETREYSGCAQRLRFTLYARNFSGGSEIPGHQPPDYYAKAVADWFSGF